MTTAILRVPQIYEAELLCAHKPRAKQKNRPSHKKLKLYIGLLSLKGLEFLAACEAGAVAIKLPLFGSIKTKITKFCILQNGEKIHLSETFSRRRAARQPRGYGRALAPARPGFDSA